jgi:hypothetical protein
MPTAMTSSGSKAFSPAKSLEIKTKSIETTLVPLVTQISTLVNFKEKSRLSSTTNEKSLRAVNRVGEAVHMAVERFVSVGTLTEEQGFETLVQVLQQRNIDTRQRTSSFTSVLRHFYALSWCIYDFNRSG